MLVGEAAIAIWCHIDAARRGEHDAWHSGEHLPERLGIPGFLRGRRCRAADEAVTWPYFILYEVRDASVMTSPAYLERLNDPTPWSRKIFASCRLSRTLCRVVESRGRGVGGHVVTSREGDVDQRGPRPRGGYTSGRALPPFPPDDRMKICRFDDDRVGVVRGDKVHDVTEAVVGLREPAIEGLQKLKSLDFETRKAIPLAEVRLLSPVRAPGKILAAPVNYKAHIAEMQKSNVSPGFNIWDIEKAGLFLKATSSLVGPSQGIAQRFLDRRTDHEVELVVVIGKTASRVSRKDAITYVAGYCLGLDVTVRGSEDRSFRKSIDTYTVLGPWLTTADQVPDPGNIQIRLEQNGEVRQDASTSDLLWDVSRLIEFASSFYTLHPGDVFFTGTPQGVSPIRPGDRLRAHSDALGTMLVEVREAS
ncbi:MAG: fumarylacetoacetate hydrolase family protein [Betaproteobacteria bacterium]